MKRLTFREPLALALLLALAAPALAQSGGPRTLPELKADVEERANRHAYPVSDQKIFETVTLPWVVRMVK